MNAMKLAIPLFVALAYGPSQGLAQSILGSDTGSVLSTFAVLGGTGAAPMTSAGSTVITGNLGVFGGPTNAITGFNGFPTNNIAPGPGAVTGGAGIVNGTIYPGGMTPQLAQTQLTAAIGLVNAGSATLANTIAATATLDLDGNLYTYQQLQVGQVIAPGTYDVGAGATNLGINKTLILDGGGDANAVWRFRSTSSLITSEDSDIIVQDVGTGAGVGIYWSVVSFATLDGDTFAGNVLANALISSNGTTDMGQTFGLTVGCGRLLSKTAVTLIGDSISTGCGVAGDIGFGSGGFDQAAMVPEPEIYAMMASGLGLMGWVARRRKQKAA